MGLQFVAFFLAFFLPYMPPPVPAEVHDEGYVQVADEEEATGPPPVSPHVVDTEVATTLTRAAGLTNPLAPDLDPLP